MRAGEEEKEGGGREGGVRERGGDEWERRSGRRELARSQHVCMRPLVVDSLFLHLFAVDSLDVLTLRSSFV